MTTATALVLELDTLRASRAPLYHRYDREINPQPAFVLLSEEGEVSADSSGEIGNGIPSSVWHGRDLRFPVSPFASGSDLADFLERFDRGRVLLERIHEGHSVEWDGSNYVGTLDDDAQAARDELEAALQEVEEADVQRVEDWLGAMPWADLWPVADNHRQAVEALEHTARQDGIVLDGDVGDYLLSRLWTESDWPSDLAKEGKWEEARRLWERWEGAAVAAGAQPRDLAADVDDLADAVDLSWLPGEVRDELVRRRVDAVDAWAEANPETPRHRAHFTRFGVSLQPSIADAEGYLQYREDFRDLPPEEWTGVEAWIAREEDRIQAWRQGRG
jgi:hypothetical protein